MYSLQFLFIFCVYVQIKSIIGHRAFLTITKHRYWQQNKIVQIHPILGKRPSKQQAKEFTVCWSGQAESWRHGYAQQA